MYFFWRKDKEMKNWGNERFVLKEREREKRQLRKEERVRGFVGVCEREKKI